jgi:hypothetical protein
MRKKSRIVSHTSGDRTHSGNIDSVWCTLPYNHQTKMYNSLRQDKDMDNHIVIILIQISVIYIQMALDIHKSVFTQKISDMKNGVFWDVTPCGSCKNRSFGGT